MSVVQEVALSTAKGAAEALKDTEKSEFQKTPDGFLLAGGAVAALAKGLQSATQEIAEKWAQRIKDDLEHQEKMRDEEERNAANPSNNKILRDLGEGLTEQQKKENTIRGMGSTTIANNLEAEQSFAAVNRSTSELAALIRDNPGKTLAEIEASKSGLSSETTVAFGKKYSEDRLIKALANRANGLAAEKGQVFA